MPNTKVQIENHSVHSKYEWKGLTREKRHKVGKAARTEVPIALHAKLSIQKKNRDIVGLIKQSSKGRIKELIPERHGRMLESPFAFFRGSAGLMANDLSGTASSGFLVQACGDCHIHNFSGYATPERQLVVDINDFDESMPAPWEWDVKRLAASLVLASGACGLSEDLGQEAAALMAEGYREHLSTLSLESPTNVWYSHILIDDVLKETDKQTRKAAHEEIEKAQKKASPEALAAKLLVESKNKLRFRKDHSLFDDTVYVDIGNQINHSVNEYLRTIPEHMKVLLSKFEVADITSKVVGVGSVGNLCAVVLLTSSDNDILILQVKQARESVLAPFVEAPSFEHQGHRVVYGQRLMQAASDIFLGWVTGRQPENWQFYVRQLRDIKVEVDTSTWDKKDFRSFSKIAGHILARAHARSGDAAILSGYLGRSDNFDFAISEYAKKYAKQVEKDYDVFAKACNSGVLEARLSV